MTVAVVFLIVVFLGAIPIAAVLLNKRVNLLPQQEVTDRPVTAIAALHEGERARIRGVVIAREPLLKSAICEKPCVGYQATIRDAGQDPALLSSSEAWSSFLVADETGAVAVEGRLQAFLDLDDRGTELPPRAHVLLAENGVRTRELWGPRQFRYRERRLCVGDRISVLGRPSPANAPPGGGSRGEPPVPYVMRGTTYDQVILTDDDEDVGQLLAKSSPAVPLDEAPAVRGPSRRAIEHRESSAIATLQEGDLAKITGVVRPREPLATSPVSGRTCVGYRVTIRQRREGNSLDQGVLVVRREAWPSFLVVDDTGMAVAEGPFAILLDPDDGGWTNLPATVYSLLEEAKVPLDKEFVFRETLLVPGDRVSVVGRPSLQVDPAGQRTLREPPRLHVFRGSEEEPVAIIDDEPAL